MKKQYGHNDFLLYRLLWDIYWGWTKIIGCDLVFDDDITSSVGDGYGIISS